MSPLKVTAVGDREIHMTRGFRAPKAAVFAALTDPEMVREWMLGPPGWRFVECRIDARVGGEYRYLWAKDGGVQMGMRGRFVELAPPDRMVHTELFDMYTGQEETVITTVLTEAEGETLLTMVIVYPSQKMRDAMVAAPMEKGVSASYERLDAIFAGRA